MACGFCMYACIHAYVSVLGLVRRILYLEALVVSCSFFFAQIRHSQGLLGTMSTGLVERKR